MEQEVNTGSRNITEDVTNLVDTYVDIAKADATRKLADITSFSVSGFLIVVFACFILLFAALGLAWWIGQLLSSVSAGLLIVAALFGLFLLILIMFKEKILHPFIRNKVVKKLYE